MITATKILIQPPYRDGFNLSFAESAARLAFYLTYFDSIVPIAFNPNALPGQGVLASTRLEQEFVHSGGKFIQAHRVNIDNVHDPAFLNGMAAYFLNELNTHEGGFALASAESFVAPPTTAKPVDRLILTLENCLPSPHHDTPLEELLAFKREHEAELRAFHEAVDDLYYGFGTRPLDSLLPRFRDQLDRHVEQTIRAYELRHIRTYLGILKIGIKIAPAALGEAIGWLAGVPIVGSLVGGAIGLAADRTVLRLDDNSVPKDFEYVLSGLSAGHQRAFPHEAPIATDLWGPGITHSVMGTSYPSAVTEPSRGDMRGVVSSHNLIF